MPKSNELAQIYTFYVSFVLSGIVTTLRGEKGASRLHLCRCFVVPRFTSILLGVIGRL